MKVDHSWFVLLHHQIEFHSGMPSSKCFSNYQGVKVGSHIHWNYHKTNTHGRGKSSAQGAAALPAGSPPLVSGGIKLSLFLCGLGASVSWLWCTAGNLCARQLSEREGGREREKIEALISYGVHAKKIIEQTVVNLSQNGEKKGSNATLPWRRFEGIRAQRHRLCTLLG